MAYHSRRIDFFEKVLALLNTQGQIYLITLLQTWGSAPRPVGSHLCITLAGEIMGSVSGGCVEEMLTNALAGMTNHTFPRLYQLKISGEHAQRHGLPCGGEQTLLIEKITSADVIRDLISQLKMPYPFSRTVELRNGTQWFARSNTDLVMELSEDHITQHFPLPISLFITGCNDLSQAVSSLALQLDYQVLICEPRQDVLQNCPSDDVLVITEMPDDFLREHCHNKMAVLALSHDPRLDDMALMEALSGPAFYIGALGSVANSNKRIARLRQLHINEDDLARLHAPIGLDIGSRTPVQIAIAIHAELIQYLHRATKEQNRKEMVI